MISIYEATEKNRTLKKWVVDGGDASTRATKWEIVGINKNGEKKVMHSNTRAWARYMLQRFQNVHRDMEYILIKIIAK